MKRSAAALFLFGGLWGCDLTVHANKKCDWSNCQGCCAADGSCQSGSLAQACGMSGAACSNCAERGKACFQGSCESAGSGGGATGGAGGAGGGGGGGATGGAGGGTAGGGGGFGGGGGLPVWAQEAYLKASNTGAGDGFGGSVTLSADGSTLAVGAWSEDSNATGVNGNQGDNSASMSGAVYVFRRIGSAWAQEAYLKASNTGAGDVFGESSLALSADGSTLAVGALGEASIANGVNGNQGDNSAPASGAVYVFRRTGSAWAQEAYLKASNTGAGDYFGYRVTLSTDGITLAIGAYAEASNATGVNGNQGDNSAPGSGAVYVFRRTGGAWAQEAYLKASHSTGGGGFGYSVTLSADGSTLAMGALWEGSNATGVNGNQGDHSAPDSGAVYVFRRTGIAWAQEAYLKASNTGAGDHFGVSVSLSADGSALAVGAAWESSNAIGVNGNESDNSAEKSGAVYVFRRIGSVWAQEVYLKASNTGAGDQFGDSVTLSSDGSTLAVGAPTESSNAIGVNGSQGDNSAMASGAVYVFQRIDSAWAQEAFLKASNTEAYDYFGRSIILSADGGALAVGAWGEDSNATGVNGNQSGNSASNSGAVYMFRL